MKAEVKSVTEPYPDLIRRLYNITNKLGQKLGSQAVPQFYGEVNTINE